MSDLSCFAGRMVLVVEYILCHCDFWDKTSLQKKVFTTPVRSPNRSQRHHADSASICPWGCDFFIPAKKHRGQRRPWFSCQIPSNRRCYCFDFNAIVGGVFMGRFVHLWLIENLSGLQSLFLLIGCVEGCCWGCRPERRNRHAQSLAVPLTSGPSQGQDVNFSNSGTEQSKDLGIEQSQNPKNEGI